MKLDPVATAIGLGAVGAAALVAPWPVPVAALAVVANWVVVAGVFVDAAQRPAEAREYLARWTFALSLSRIAAALGVARAAASVNAGGAMAAVLSDVGLAISASLAGVVLAIVALLVISSGAVRVAEVAARFALDSLPGKQLGLDAAVQAGSVPVEAAAEGLARIEGEATFFAAMDAALRFLRAEAVALTLVGIVGAAAGAALHFQAWPAAVVVAATGSCGLLVATVVAASSCVLVITALPHEGRTREARVQLRAVAIACLAGAGVVVVAEMVGGGVTAAAVVTAVVLAAAGAAAEWLWRAGGRADEEACPAVVVLAGPAPEPVRRALEEAVAAVREALRQRLGFDAGAVAVEHDPAGEERSFKLRLRGLDTALQWRCGGEAARLGDGAARAPDSRPMQWLARPPRGPDELGCAELTSWWVFRHAVVNAELLFTPAAARRLVADAIDAGGPDTIGTAGMVSVARELLRRGLPVPPAELFADALISADEDARRRRLAEMAARTLVGRAAGRITARQLHADGRRLLQELAAGGFMGEELEELKQQIIAESWTRPDWRWPMLLVEQELRPYLERLLADYRAEVVVLEPDELPAGVYLPTIEVLGSGSA